MRSRLGRAMSVLWWCRVWDTGRSPPPSWNLSHPVCWPEPEWPPSQGPKLSTEHTHMTLSARLIQKRNTEIPQTPSMTQKRTLSGIFKHELTADSGWSETSLCHGCKPYKRHVYQCCCLEMIKIHVKLHIKYNKSYILSEIVTSLFLEGNWWATILALILIKCYRFNLQWTVLRFLVKSQRSDMFTLCFCLHLWQQSLYSWDLLSWNWLTCCVR